MGESTLTSPPASPTPTLNTLTQPQTRSLTWSSRRRTLHKTAGRSSRRSRRSHFHAAHHLIHITTNLNSDVSDLKYFATNNTFIRVNKSDNPAKGSSTSTAKRTKIDDGTEITFTRSWIECNTTANMKYKLELSNNEDSDSRLVFVISLADGGGRGIARIVLHVLVFVLALII
ncbi:hypothetical protein BLNAU_24291 [Blattamonas nauphoetae]|uniref:Uncharacterized protein n=1 Tax=Blattamonas nauphoetae TaxID=2049346 RepID=A0ABQ9WMU2_9EUKA|nr:hypothetical protein BLNAU_24291 [Blattamonas nauphoetae]